MSHKFVVTLFIALTIVCSLSHCTPLEVHQLALRSSQTLMPADGESKASLQVVALGADRKELKEWSSQAQLYLNNRDYNQKEFVTKDTGTYHFVARLGNLQSNVVSIEAASAKQYVHHLMKGTYLWANKAPKTDITKYKTPEDILNRMAYRPERQGSDRWSNISDRVAYDNYYNGKYVGLGLRMSYDKDNQLRMVLVYEDTPAHKAGIRRGMIVKSINGKSIKEIEDEKRWDTIFGENKEGVEVAFRLLYNGVEKEYKAAKSSVLLRSVFSTKFLQVNDKQVGYLYFDRFITPSEDELKKEFTRMKDKGIDEFVLDVRYNGGGLLRVASQLGGLIAGQQGKNKIFYKYAHNDNFRHWNSDSRFEPKENSLNIKRVFVITSGSTASASEVVINGLRPLLPVVLVGRKTYGKPVGAYNFAFFNKIISLISFRVVNDAGEGDYYQGIPVDISADDDITHDLGDPNEACLKAALQAISTNNLPLLPHNTNSHKPIKRIPWTGIRQVIQAF